MTAIPSESLVAALERQLIELEMRVAFQDDAMDTLNQTLLAQSRQMERMALQLEQLQDRLKTYTPSPLDVDETERPPHY
jgi:SlyX protein